MATGGSIKELEGQAVAPGSCLHVLRELRISDLDPIYVTVVIC